jgi:hypothetical protein
MSQWDDDERNVKVNLNNAVLGDVEAPSWFKMPTKINIHKEIAALLEENKWNCFNDVEFVDYAFEAPAVVHQTHEASDATPSTPPKPIDKTSTDDFEVNNEIEMGAWHSKFMYT